MTEPRFLTLDDILYIHEREIATAGGAPGIRDRGGIESALGAVQATYNGEFLQDIYGMAATYLNSIVNNHPFMDGNKRTGLASALTFLLLNGIEITERREEELADLVLQLTENVISKEAAAAFFKERASQ